MTMLNLCANIFRYMFTSSSRSEATLPTYIFQGLFQNPKQNDYVKYVRYYFLVYVYVKFQIRSNTANLYFPGTFPNNHYKVMMLNL